MASSQQNAGTNAAVEVVPLTLHIGAEIRGVDLKQPLRPQQVNEVRDAFLKWKVIFFRDQHLDHCMSRWPASSASRRSVMPCSAMSRAIRRSTRWPKTAPPMRTANK